MIALVALVCAAPFVSAWVAYYFVKPEGGKSYGELLPTTQIVTDQDRNVIGGEPVKGKWIVFQHELGSCDEQCLQSLYASRQARTMLGKDKDRLVRVLTIKSPPADVAVQHVDLVVKDATSAVDLSEPYRRGLVLVDPLGNQVIVWPKNPDIKKMNQDLARLMRASRIG